MKIIISPAKKMRTDSDALPAEGLPVFTKRAQVLLDWLRSLSYDEAKKIWACSDKIASEAYARLDQTQLEAASVPAILSYDGIAYTYMAPSVFDYGEFGYVQEHLRILSGFYGILRPMDAVAPYRLEMQAKAKVDGYINLYEFWGDTLYNELIDQDHLIINLASKEYSKAIEAHLQPEDRFITCTFAQEEKARLVQKGVYCKMARGEMVRFMARNNVNDPEQLKSFDSPDWHFDPNRSTDNELLFIRY